MACYAVPNGSCRRVSWIRDYGNSKSHEQECLMHLLWLRSLFEGLSARLIAVGAAAAAFLLLLLGHKRSVSRAEDRGRDTGEASERNRVFRETVREEAEIEEIADEVRETHSDIADDELRRRMRRAATRSSDES